MEWWQAIIAIGGGFLAGIINTLAGSGSAITLSILSEVLFLSPLIANGTNRVGVFAQTLISTATFYRHGKLPLNAYWSYIIPTVIGAIVGVWAAVSVSNEQFKFIFRILLVLMLVTILVKPSRWLINQDDHFVLPYWISLPVFLALGFYGGFIQMGMGVFYLAILVLASRIPIIRANAIKLFVIAIYSVFVLALFQYRGMINWEIGLIMASGQSLGGWLTARYASKSEKAAVWAYRLLVFIVIWAIISTWAGPIQLAFNSN